MDPNACLQRLADALADMTQYRGTFDRDLYEEARSEAMVAVHDLAIWLGKGGFEPDWTTSPEAAAYFEEHR